MITSPVLIIGCPWWGAIQYYRISTEAETVIASIMERLGYRPGESRS